ncbi:MAG TPA: 3-deoxy-7-phosphoheptulonate synthase [Armatimonadota bacterium]|nr:3-deoxy-7-phosphoheptulonate synthase [Armatimonadota bacterium]
MIVVMKAGASQEQIDAVVEAIRKKGLRTHLSAGEERTIVGVIGGIDFEKEDLINHLEAMPCVERAVPVSHPYKFASREWRREKTVVNVAGVLVGGPNLVVMAGPCTVESREQILETAHAVKAAGATILRGGAFKPRTSPYQFQGLGKEALELLAEARDQTGMPVITEVLDTQDVPLVEEYADILQIGTRNMANFALLKRVGRSRRPVMIKRGMASTVDEWLQAAEYVLAEGNANVLLCERGIRTFEPSTRNTFDVNGMIVALSRSHLPVVADPSQGTGRRSMVAPLSMAAVAAGADALIVEVHPDPVHASTDGAQSVNISEFQEMMVEIGRVAAAVRRPIATAESAG